MSHPLLPKLKYQDKIDALSLALLPLVNIAEAYDRNELDDEARKYWGLENENQNMRNPQELDLYTGRGGKRLLTLADCLQAREIWMNNR